MKFRLCLLLLLITISRFEFLNAQPIGLRVDIGESGLTEVTHIVSVDNVTTQVRLLAKPIDDLIIVTDEDGIPVSYTLNDTLMIAETYGVERINITYLTYGVVEMVEGLWRVRFSSSSRCEIILPRSSNIVYMNIIPEEVEAVNGRIRVLMPPGSYEIQYVILPKPTSTIQTYTTPQSIPPQSKTIPPPSTIQTYPTPPQAPQISGLLPLLIVVVILAVALLAYLMVKTKGRVRFSGVELLILDYLKSRGGAYQDDIVKDLKLPKSTASRALSSLVKKGIIEIRRVARRNYVKLK
jgi:uncharacterized membrane protein